MFRYILKRLGQTLIVLFFVSVFAFSLIRMAPGNPALMMLPDGAPEEAVKAMEIKMGLNQPLYIQYARYIADVLRGDLGTSSSYKTEVGPLIWARLPSTASLSLVSVAVGCMLCIPLGIIAGSNRGSAIDFITMFFALFGQAMAPVWLAVLIIFVFAVRLGWLPAIGSGSLAHYVLPVFTLAYPMAAETTRIGRSGMIDTLSEDYITATYAKGVRPFVVNWKYAFKNAICPVITLVGMRLCAFLAGALIVETIFAWPGIGQLLTQAVGNRDYALVQSLLLVCAALFALVNLVVDIVNSLIDPRIVLE